MVALSVGIYLTSLLVIFFYAIIQFLLAFAYLKKKKKKDQYSSFDQNYFPFVTVQLPVYNEKYVIERLLSAVEKIEWPSDKLEIQVLDDSTDETSRLVDKYLSENKNQRIPIHVIRRESRAGYKAGALKNALPLCKGDFIAIFDADFVPPKDFLLNTIPHFADNSIGVVQTRWGHINEQTSLLTKLQAFGLDAHFSVEQCGRNEQGCFINFNGTAGVWRKSTIDDAGGWSDDTLTEDLDLSYRAQLKGWKFIYREDIVSPAELPVSFSALKSQQYRWTKGGAETFKKMFSKIITSNAISYKQKIHGLAHLFNSSVFVFVLLLLLSSVSIFYFTSIGELEIKWLHYSSVFFISTLFLLFYYAVSFHQVTSHKVLNILIFMFRFLSFLTVSLGLSLHNSWAVINGYFGKKSEFVRTPKFKIEGKQLNRLTKNSYSRSNFNWLIIVEGLLAILFITCIIRAFETEISGMLPFHFMAATGFLSVFLGGLREYLNR